MKNKTHSQTKQRTPHKYHTTATNIRNKEHRQQHTKTGNNIIKISSVRHTNTIRNKHDRCDKNNIRDRNSRNNHINRTCGKTHHEQSQELTTRTELTELTHIKHKHPTAKEITQLT